MTFASHHRLSLAAPAALAVGVLGAAAAAAALGPVIEVRAAPPAAGAVSPAVEATLPAPVTERRRDAITDLGF